MAWVLRFVDGTGASRATRLDLNNAAATPSIELNDYDDAPNPDFGEAAIERTTADPVGRDGQIVTSSKRINREVVLPLLIHGTSAEFATAMGRIARECDRARNYLEWQPDGVNPVFFVVHQGTVSNPDVEHAGANVWTCELTLTCDPTALGAEETATVSVSNDPAGGQTFTMPAVKGDVPAPLNLAITTTFATQQTRTYLTHAHTTEGGASSRAVIQAESGTFVNDTAVQANDVKWSGSGSNSVRTTFATVTGLTKRIDLAGITAVGQYKALLRVGKTAATNTFDVRADWGSGGEVVTGQTKHYPSTANTGPHWLDMGVVSFPAGATMPPSGGTVSSSLQIFAGRTAGTGSLDYDCLVLLPVDLEDLPETQLAHVYIASTELGGFTLGLNSEDERVYAESTASGNVIGKKNRVGGAFPMVRPGFDNHVAVMLKVGTDSAADDIALSSSVAWTYNPRYLFVA